MDKAPEGLAESGVRDVALVLVEFTGREQATRRYERLMQLVHDRGFADAGISGDEHQFERARGHDTVKGREQRVDLATPAVKLLRDQQPVRYVVSAERERVDTVVRLQFRQAAPEIGFDTRGGLVAILCCLGYELHHNSRERRRDANDPLVGRHRLPRDMAVHPLHRIDSGEGQRPCQHLVEGDAQCVEIAAGVHGAVHPASLFRRHVGKRPGDLLRRRGRLMFT